MSYRKFKIMSKKLVDLSLPAFAFVDGWGDDDNLQGRTVIVHCPTGTILEVLPTKDILYVDDDNYRSSFVFKFTGVSSIEEAYIMMLHTSPTFDKVADAGTIKELMKEAAKWLVNYFTWEDHNIIREKYEQK